jgi:hypothetical protein
MARIAFGQNPSQLKPFTIDGLSISFDNQGIATVSLTLSEVVNVRWNAPAERWEWFEDGQWVS